MAYNVQLLINWPVQKTSQRLHRLIMLNRIIIINVTKTTQAYNAQLLE